MTRVRRWWLLPLAEAALIASVAFFIAWGNRWSIARHLMDLGELQQSLQSQSISQRYAIIATVLLVAAATGFAIWVGDRRADDLIRSTAAV